MKSATIIVTTEQLGITWEEHNALGWQSVKDDFLASRLTLGVEQESGRQRKGWECFQRRNNMGKGLEVREHCDLGIFGNLV